MSDPPVTGGTGARSRLSRLLPDPPGAPAVGADTDALAPEEPDAPRGPLARLGGAAAFDPGRPGVRVLAVVAGMVVLSAALFAWWSRPQPEPLVAQLTATAPAAAAAPTTPPELVVAVTGLVHQPGLVRLPPGSRVADAIEAAGGTLPEAELDYLNLARRLTDGELVAVGIPPPPEATGAGDGSSAGGKVNLNTASTAELETLPGVGPALAQRIIDYRTAHGPFGSVSELRQVSGIGEVRYAELRDLVAV